MNVVDGGYFDTSAASTISELYSALKHLIDAKNADEDSKTPCVVPVFLQIDNAYIDVTATSFKRPLESTVPIATMLETRNAREAQSRLYAATLFHERRSGPSRYAHIYHAPTRVSKLHWGGRSQTPRVVISVASSPIRRTRSSSRRSTPGTQRASSVQTRGPGTPRTR